MRTIRLRFLLALCLVAVLGTAPALATWSFAIANTKTGEVGVGTVTCLRLIDLKQWVPVVVVGKGAGCSQSALDTTGDLRRTIFDGLGAGSAPTDILGELAGFAGHTTRQFGIVDTQGRSATYSGPQAGIWRGSVEGQFGDFVYAVQGNVLAGSCVVPAIEEAIIETEGDLAEKMMAAHRAARDTGGDGRCSCNVSNPTGCGCPPPPGQALGKSGHVGCMIIGRIGDTDDDNCDRRGCADGDYFMDLNAAFLGDDAPDPVDVLEESFVLWRTELIGRPDAVRSRVSFSRPTLPPGRAGTTTMKIDLRDWQGRRNHANIASVSVEHAPGSDRRTSIGPVVENADGSYSVILTQPALDRRWRGRDAGGFDRFRIVVDDQVRPVTLMPDPVLSIRRADATSK